MIEVCEENSNPDIDRLDLLHKLNSPKYFVSSLNEFLEVLQDYEKTTKSKFVLLSSYKKFSEGSVELKDKMKLHWEDDFPYFHFGTRIYGCHLGRDVNRYQKEKYKKLRDAQALKNPFIPRFRQRKQSKKLNCPAVIRVTRMVRITEFKVPITGSVTKSLERAKISRLIKKKINKCEPVGEECFMFNLPDVGDHKHHSTGANISEPIDQRVKEQIFSLVQSGEHKAVVISKLLNVFVENELKITDRLKKGYYPDLKTIRKFIYKAKASPDSIKIDKRSTNVTDQTLQFPKTDSYSSLNLSENNGSISEILEDDSNDSITKNFKEFVPNKILSENVEELNETLPENSEGDESNESSNIREINKKNLISSCDSSIQLIQSIMKYINEKKLEQLSKKLDGLVYMFANKVTTQKCTRCPVKSYLQVERKNNGKLLSHEEQSSELGGRPAKATKESIVKNSYNFKFPIGTKTCATLHINSTLPAKKINPERILLPPKGKASEISKALVASKIVSDSQASEVNDRSTYNNFKCPNKMRSSVIVSVKSVLSAERLSLENRLLQCEEEPKETLGAAANRLTAFNGITVSQINKIVGSDSLKRQQESKMIVTKRKKDNPRPPSNLQGCQSNHRYRTKIL